MRLHKFFDFLAFERRDNGSLLLLYENSIESVLITDRVEDVQLLQAQSVPLAVFKLLEELGLRLVVEVGVLDVLCVLVPDS